MMLHAGWAAVLAVAMLSAACYDPDRVVAPDEALAITAIPASIPADGFSTSQITVRVPQGTRRDLTFTFKNEGGTLSTPASQNRGPDANGEISVFLKSDPSPRTALVTVEAKEKDTVVTSASVAVTFTTPGPSSVVRLTASRSQVEADGVSSIQLRAEVNPAVTTRAVTFTTSNGSFERGANPPRRTLADQATGADGVVVVQLYAPDELGTAVVTAAAGGFSDSETITFEPAAPDFISLSADPLTLPRTETNWTTLRATLSRRIGTVTDNTLVDFSITSDVTGASFGRFEQITRSTDGVATARFIAGASAPPGLATITARVPGTAVSAQTKITIAP